MSGALDAEAREMAVEMLAEFGAPAVVTFVDSAGAVASIEPCSSVREYIHRIGTGGWAGRDSEILEGDEHYFLDAPSLSRRPEIGDRLTVGAVTYNITRTEPLQPGVLPILYRCQVKT